MILFHNLESILVFKEDSWICNIININKGVALLCVRVLVEIEMLLNVTNSELLYLFFRDNSTIV